MVPAKAAEIASAPWTKLAPWNRKQLERAHTRGSASRSAGLLERLPGTNTLSCFHLQKGLLPLPCTFASVRRSLKAQSIHKHGFLIRLNHISELKLVRAGFSENYLSTSYSEIRVVFFFALYWAKPAIMTTWCLLSWVPHTIVSIKSFFQHTDFFIQSLHQYLTTLLYQKLKTGFQKATRAFLVWTFSQVSALFIRNAFAFHQESWKTNNCKQK